MFSLYNGLVRITSSEGTTALWSGSYPTILPAIARAITIAASGVAAFFASFFGLPFGSLKTRLQRGGSQYKGMLDCAMQAYRKEGPLRFYRGFGTYVFRIAPHTIITLIVADSVTASPKWTGVL